MLYLFFVDGMVSSRRADRPSTSSGEPLSKLGMDELGFSHRTPSLISRRTAKQISSITIDLAPVAAGTPI